MFLVLQDPWLAWGQSFLAEINSELGLVEKQLQFEAAGAQDDPKTWRLMARSAPGSRAFLTHVHWLLWLTSVNPLLHQWALRELCHFVQNYLAVERRLADRAQLQPSRWRRRYGKRLIRAAASDPLFGSISLYDRLPVAKQAQMVQGIATELGMPDASDPPMQQQMN